MSPEPLGDLSQWLKQLKVAVPELDRDKLLFEAGRRSLKRASIWPMALSLCLTLATTSALVWMSLHPRVQERIVYVPAELRIDKQMAKSEIGDSLPLENEMFSYAALLQNLVRNKQARQTTGYDAVKQQTVQTVGSYVEWFPRQQ